MNGPIKFEFPPIFTIFFKCQFIVDYTELTQKSIIVLRQRYMVETTLSNITNNKGYLKI